MLKASLGNLAFFKVSNASAFVSIAEFYWLVVGSLPTSYYHWIVDLGNFPEAQKVLATEGLAVLFFLVSRPGGGNNFNARSHYFNITNSAQSTTTSSTTSNTASASSTPVSTSASPSVAQNPNNQQESPAIPGGAIGGAVGGTALLSALGFLIWYLLRKKKQSKASPFIGEALKHTQVPPIIFQEYSKPAELPYAPPNFPQQQLNIVHEAPWRKLDVFRIVICTLRLLISLYRDTSRGSWFQCLLASNIDMLKICFHTHLQHHTGTLMSQNK